MSCGLFSLRQLLGANGPEQYNLVRKNLLLAKHLLAPATSWEPRKSIITDDDREAVRKGGKLNFTGDDIQKRNEAFLWENDYLLTEERYDHYNACALRRCGYVFWDSDRLRSCGMLDIRYFPPFPSRPRTYLFVLSTRVNDGSS